MAARDSDDDIRKYLPELSTILREADPARAKEKLSKAQDNPELDAALAHAQRPSARPSAASPWAAEPVGIAAAALPSSPAAPPVVKKPEARHRKRAPFSAWSNRTKGIVAVLAAVGPVTVLWVLLVRPSGRENVDPVRVAVSAGSSVSAAPTVSASAASPPMASARTTENPAPSSPAVPVIQDDAGTVPGVPVERDAGPAKPSVKPAPNEDDPYSTPPKKPAPAKPDAAPMIF